MQNSWSVIWPLQSEDGEATTENKDVEAYALYSFQDSVGQPVLEYLRIS